MEGIITSLIGGLCVGIPSVIATLSSNKKTMSLLTYRIGELEKKTDKHNKVIERQYKLEQRVDDLDDYVNKLHK